MSEAERQVKATYPTACCTSRVKFKRDGSREHVFEILRTPFPDKANRPVSSACLTPAAAWQSAAMRLAAHHPDHQPNQRERTL